MTIREIKQATDTPQLEGRVVRAAIGERTADHTDDAENGDFVAWLQLEYDDGRVLTLRAVGNEFCEWVVP